MVDDEWPHSLDSPLFIATFSPIMDGREFVKSLLPASQWRALRRATNRLRWILKFNLLRHYGFDIAGKPARAMKYIFLDPEVESYTYEMGNPQAYADYIAPALGTTPQQVMAWIHEAVTDPYLTRDRGLHWSCKRKTPLGNRTMWYPIARALKPKVIVEAGVHEGVSSEMFLVALQRNAQEGHPGRLISFDIFEDTGWLVHPELKKNWTFILEATDTGLKKHLKDVEVDLFVHETPHTNELLTTEFEAIFQRAAPRLGIVDSSGKLRDVLKDYATRFGTQHHFFLDEPKDHIVKSHGMGFALFERSKMSGLSVAPVMAGEQAV